MDNTDVNDIEDQNVKRLREIVSKIDDFTLSTNSINLDSANINMPMHYRSPSNQIYQFKVKSPELNRREESSISPRNKIKTQYKYYRLTNICIFREKFQYFNIFASFGFLGSGTWILSSKVSFNSLVLWLTIIFACYIFYIFKTMINCGYEDNAINEITDNKQSKSIITLYNGETIMISAIKISLDDISEMNYDNIVAFNDFCMAHIIEKNSQTFIRLTNLYKNHKMFINLNNIYYI